MNVRIDEGEMADLYVCERFDVRRTGDSVAITDRREPSAVVLVLRSANLSAIERFRDLPGHVIRALRRRVDACFEEPTAPKTVPRTGRICPKCNRAKTYAAKRVEDLERQRFSLATQLDDAEKERDQFRVERDEACARLEAVRRELDEWRKSHADVCKERDEARRQANDLFDEWRKAYGDARKERDELRAAMSDALHDLNHMIEYRADRLTPALRDRLLRSGLIAVAVDLTEALKKVKP